MSERLARAASGLRHLRWAREVLATLEAHAEHDPRLSAPEREALRGEAERLAAVIDALSAAVKAYRDFLERTRVLLRGRARMAASVAAAGAPGGAALAARFEAERAVMERGARWPRKEALGAAIDALRAALSAMDARLGARISAAFVEGLYPALAAGGTRVADDGDPDDDAAAEAG